MVQPINYGGAFAPQRPVNLFENVMQVRALQDRQRMQQDAANREAMFQADYQAAMESGLTPQKLIGLDAKHPGSLKNFKDILGQVQEDQRQGYIQNIVPVHNLLQKGDVKNARMLADRTRDAYRNSGDEQKAQQWAFFGEQIDAGQGLGISSGMLAAAGPDAVESYETIQVTPENIEKTKAETQRIQMELKEDAELNDGKIPVEKRPDYELKLRNQYLKEADTYQEINRNYRNIKNSPRDGVGALTTILSFMKTIDPTSVVSSTEKVTAESAPGWPEAMRNVFNKIFEEGKMGDTSYKQFLAAAKSIRDNAKIDADKSRRRIGSQAKKYGLDVENIFNPEETVQPAVQTQTAVQGEQPTDVVAGEKIFKFKTQEEAEKFKAEARARGLLK